MTIYLTIRHSIICTYLGTYLYTLKYTLASSVVNSQMPYLGSICMLLQNHGRDLISISMGQRIYCRQARLISGEVNLTMWAEYIYLTMGAHWGRPRRPPWCSPPARAPSSARARPRRQRARRSWHRAASPRAQQSPAARRPSGR